MTMPVTNNKGFKGAYIRGASARMAGMSRKACPYRIGPNRRNAGTWSATWRNYWLRGYDDAKSVEHPRSKVPTGRARAA